MWEYLVKKVFSRKFLVTETAIVVLVVALYLGRVTGGQFISGLITIVGFFISGNTLAFAIDRKNGTKREIEDNEER
jgi:hypothetical protein